MIWILLTDCVSPASHDFVHPVATSIQRMGTGSTGQSVDLDRKFMAVFIASCLGLNFSDSGLWTRAVQQCGEGGWQDQRRRQFT